MSKILKITNLVKNYGDIQAIKGISFQVEEGSFFSFLGHNGAGKSTTINIISTLLTKDDGTVKVLDFEVGKDDDEIRKNIGVVFQDSLLDNKLTVEENLRLRASFYHLSEELINQRLLELDNTLEIKSILKQRYGSLSGGQRRRVDIARALINKPRLLILDEPTTGLDPKARMDVWKTLKRLQLEDKITIFLTTHYMEETLSSDKVVILDKGKIVAEGTPEELRIKYSSDVLRLYSQDDKLQKELDDLKINYEIDRDILVVKLANSKEGLEILNRLTNLDEFEIIKGNMDNVFLNATGKVGED